MTCPAPEVLAAWRAGALPLEVSKTVEAHVKGCEACSRSTEEPEPNTVAEPTAATVGNPQRPRRRERTAPAIGPGSVVGRYVVVSELGKGGMGAVYAAYDPQLDRKVALKLLLLSEGTQLSAPEAAARLQREAQALARVSHPNTVAIYDVGTHEGRVFLAMEHLKGVTLRPWLEQEPRSWREAVRVCREAGQGLAAVHAAGLVHRDFKPANVIVTPEGTAKVLDFGLARLAPDSDHQREPVDFADADFEFPSGSLETPLTEEGSLSGTPGYIAPELLLGQAASAASDQFAFGVSLHLALYGTRPFKSSTFEEMRKALDKGLPSAPPSGARAPRWLWDVVRRCLATRAADRYPSMKEVLEALARDPARARRTWALRGATALALVVAALVSARLSRVDCPTEGEFQQSLWSAADRARLSATLLRAAPAAGPQVERALLAIDERTAAWAKQSAQACVAAAGHKAARLDVQRAVCLRRRGEGTRILIEALGLGDPAVAAHCEELVSSFLRISGCVQESELERLGVDEVVPESAQSAVALRAGLLRSRALSSSSDIKGALAAAQAVVAEARDAGLVGFESEALQLSAGLDRTPGWEAEAIADLEGAQQHAIAAGTDGRAFFISESLVSWYVWKKAHLPEARATLRLMEGLWVRLGRAEDMEMSLILARDKLADAEGHPELVGRDSARAYELAARAYGVRSVEASEAARRWSAWLWNEGKLQESNRLDERALKVMEELKGPDDPSLGPYLSALGLGLEQEGRKAEGIALIDRALTVMRKGHADEADIISLELSLADILHGVDDPRALQLATRALAFAEKGEDPRQVVDALEVRADALVATGQAREGLRDCERARRLVAEIAEPDELTRRDQWLCLGMAHAALGDHHAALSDYQRAMAVQQKELLPNVRAHMNLGLARALRATHGDEARAQALAREALEALPETDGFRAEVQAFLDAAPGR